MSLIDDTSDGASGGGASSRSYGTFFDPSM